MFALPSTELLQLSRVFCDSVVNAQSVSTQAFEELGCMTVAAGSSYASVYFGCLSRLLDARSPDEAVGCWQSAVEEMLRRTRQDLKLWLATVLETSNRLGTGSLARADGVTSLVKSVA